MAREEMPWWERPAAQPPYEDGLEAKREHLRAELARAWSERREEHERRRTSEEHQRPSGSRDRKRRRSGAPVPPMPPPQAA